jgi:putative transposase
MARRTLWPAGDHEGDILDSHVNKKRNKSSALRFFEKMMKRHGSPATIVTDGLKSYFAAILNGIVYVYALEYRLA